MALKLAKELPCGYIAEYWMIGRCNLESFSKMANVQLLGFKNEEARRSGKQPMTTQQYELYAFDPKSDENALNLAYRRLKELEEFAHANDA